MRNPEKLGKKIEMRANDTIHKKFWQGVEASYWLRKTTDITKTVINNKCKNLKTMSSWVKVTQHNTFHNGFQHITQKTSIYKTMAIESASASLRSDEML